jgi:MFS family permease
LTAAVVARLTVDLTALRQSRDLRLLTIGSACAQLGTQAALVAIPYQVYVLTGSPFLVGLTGAVELVPLIVGSLLGGAWADRFDRRRVLIVSQLVVAAVAAVLTAVSLIGEPHVGVIFVLAGAMAGSAAIVNVTRAAAVPALAGPEFLRSALAANFGIANLMSVIGPSLGGLLIAGAGVEAVYGLLAAGFVAMLALTLPMRSLPPHLHGESAEHEPLGRSIAEGLRFVRSNRALLGSFVIDLSAMTFGMPRALFAVLALTVFHAGAEGTGLLYAAVAAGAVVGAVTTGWLEGARWLGRIVIGAVIVWGLAIAAAGVAPTLWTCAALLAVAGAADSVSALCRVVINQAVTPERMRGRMSSVFSLVVTSGPRLGDIESGLAASLVGVTAAVVSGGLLCVLAVGGVMLAFPQLTAYDGTKEEHAVAA